MSNLIIRFLRLFPQYRRLERECQRLKDDIEETHQIKLEYQDRLASTNIHLRAAEELRVRSDADAEALRSQVEYLKTKCDQWERDYKDMVEKRAVSTETVADFESLRLFGRTIYGRAPVTPAPKIDPNMGQPQRVHARVRVQEAEQKFNDDLKQFYARQTKQPQ